MNHLQINLPVAFISAGQFVAPENWIHPRRVLDCFTLYLVEKGVFRIHVASTEYTIRPHQFLLIPSGYEQAGERCKDHESPIYYWTHFRLLEDLSGSAQQITLNLNRLCSDYNKAAIAFRELISESRRAAPVQLACDYQMSLLLIYLSDIYDSLPQQNALFFRIKEYVRIHYHQGVSLQELSEKFNYSPEHISRLFRKSEGKTISQYQRSLRLNEAKQLLLTSVESVREIGYHCGFSNEKFFITSFSKEEGMTPTQYRNLFSVIHQNNH